MKQFLFLVLLLLACDEQTDNTKTLNEAHNLFKAEKYTEAAQLYTELIESSSHVSEAYTGRGYCFIKRNGPENSVSDFERALEHKGSSAEIYGGLALASFSTNQFTDVVTSVDKVFSTNETFKYEHDESFNTHDLLYIKATSYFQQKKFTECYDVLKNDLKKALDFDASDTQIAVKLLPILVDVLKDVKN